MAVLTRLSNHIYLGVHSGSLLDIYLLNFSSLGVYGPLAFSCITHQTVVISNFSFISTSNYNTFFLLNPQNRNTAVNKNLVLQMY